MATITKRKVKGHGCSYRVEGIRIGIGSIPWLFQSLKSKRKISGPGPDINTCGQDCPPRQRGPRDGASHASARLYLIPDLSPVLFSVLSD